jgi:archaellum component FlaF (FlaF/FlaG flagellin family)
LRGKGRKGISTVVTSVMLVSAVSLMGAFLVSWSNSSFAAKQLGVAKSVNDRVNQIKENFVVEDAWFFSNSTAKYVKITVRNAGDVQIKISAIYVNNTQVWAGSQSVAQGSTNSITFQSNWGAGKSQSLWVKTTSGSSVKQTWKGG